MESFFDIDYLFSDQGTTHSYTGNQIPSISGSGTSTKKLLEEPYLHYELNLLKKELNLHSWMIHID